MDENKPTEQIQTETSAAQTLPDEDFDALIRGKYRDAFAAKLKGILQRQAQAQREYLDYQRLLVQEAQARDEHPELKLMQELDNAEFVRLLRSGVGLKTAYEAIHHRQLLKRQAETRMDALQRLAQRPVESALDEQAPTQTVLEPAALSAKERRQLRRRAERGEKIVF